MKKKYLHLLQIDYFLKTYPIVLFVQHHNLTVKDWFHLRMQLTQNHDIHILLFKNNIIKKGLEIIENIKQTTHAYINENQEHIQKTVTHPTYFNAAATRGLISCKRRYVA